MTAETKAFPTAEVISAIAGTLICDIGGVYTVLGWMTGQELFTHQLPRASREAAPIALAFDPRLSEVVKEAEQVNETNWQEWRDRWIERFGAEIVVPKLTSEQHEKKDPIAELRELAPHAEIIPVVVDRTGEDGEEPHPDDPTDAQREAIYEARELLRSRGINDPCAIFMDEIKKIADSGDEHARYLYGVISEVRSIPVRRNGRDA